MFEFRVIPLRQPLLYIQVISLLRQLVESALLVLKDLLVRKEPQVHRAFKALKALRDLLVSQVRKEPQVLMVDLLE
jgi:hypothetical protein